MKLVRINPTDTTHQWVTYELLKEREPDEGIDFKMPSWAEHLDYMAGYPYGVAWYLIEVKNAQPPVVGDFVGTVSLAPGSEIGVFIFQSQRRNGYAREAIKLLVAKHPREQYRANINPKNLKSIALFTSLGFDWAACVLRRAGGATEGGGTIGMTVPGR